MSAPCLAATGLTLPAIDAFIRSEFETSSASVGQLADWLVQTDTLQRRHWENARRNPADACELALEEFAAAARPRKQDNISLSCVSNWECDSSQLHNRRQYPVNRGYICAVPALVLGISAADPTILTLGPVLERIEAARPGQGQAVLRILDSALDRCVRALTPVSGEGWCQGQYWRGENDETFLIEEELSELADEPEYKDLTEKQRREKIIRELNIFTRKDYLGYFPKWATDPKPHPLVETLPLPHWTTIRNAATELEAVRQRTDAHLNDLCCSMNGTWEACPYLIRWTDKDCLPDVWDDVMNQHFETGDVELEMNAAFAFWDAASLRDALHRLRSYLRLTHACEELLAALQLK